MMLDVDVGQRDQIWRKFATLAEKYKYLAIFLGLVGICQHFGPTLAIFMVRIGPILTVVKAKY